MINMIKKIILIFGIMFLLTPSVNALSTIDNNISNDNDMDTTDINPWGPVIFVKCNADYEYYYNPDPPSLSMIVGEYTVFALGRHHIRWEMNYTIVVDDIHYNKTYRGYDGIYTTVNPITAWYAWITGGKAIKWKAENKITFPFEKSIAYGGMWTFSLYIDDMDTPVKYDTYQLI